MSDEIIHKIERIDKMLYMLLNKEQKQDTYQGSLADFIETELERIQELKGSDKE